MKKILSKSSYLVVVFILSGCLNQATAIPPDPVLKDYVKKEKFALEIYELSFCLEEIADILEHDTSYNILFEKRLKLAFDKRLNKSQLFIHNKEMGLLRKSLANLKSGETIYPKAYKIMNKLFEGHNSSDFNNYSEPFKAYIEYPEQVDDICLVTLITDSPNNQAWEDIQSDKIALIRFNNWIEYGFEEFRYYPGLSSKPKSILNTRIVNFIFNKRKDDKNPLVMKSLKMIHSVVTKYNKK
jgi:hypothetical protein